jgi:hypothetical protein
VSGLEASLAVAVAEPQLVYLEEPGPMPLVTCQPAVAEVVAQHPIQVPEPEATVEMAAILAVAVVEQAQQQRARVVLAGAGPAAE